MMEDKLKQAGLSDKESRVYLALLELGPALASEISKKSGVSRTFCYDILDKLAILGLVNYISDQGTRKRYSAEHPRRILTYLDNQKKKYERSYKNIEQLLPDLISLYKTEHKPSIKFYQGAKEVKNAFWENLETKTEILSFTDTDEWQKPEFYSWVKDYLKQRKAKKIIEKILVSPTAKSLVFMQYHPAKAVTEYRWLPKDTTPPFGCEVNIWDNKVLMGVLKKPCFAVMIESKQLAGALRSVFELAWSAAEKYQ